MIDIIYNGIKIINYSFASQNCIVRPYNFPRVPLLGSKPVLRDRRCDEMIDKSAPLTWVEAQDQHRTCATENENGAPGAELSSQTHHKTPDTSTTTTRIRTVICSHPGIKVDTINTQFHTNNTIIHTAFDRFQHLEATKERPGPAPYGAGQRKSTPLTLDAARRKGSP
jgi:hypothetical protein